MSKPAHEQTTPRPVALVTGAAQEMLFDVLYLEVAQRGAFDGAVAPTPACEGAAASIGRPLKQLKGGK